MDQVSFGYRGKKVKLFGNKSDHIFNSVYRKKDWYEKALLERINKITANRRPGVFIDGGSNIGTHAIYFGMFCNSTKVICYEPCEPIASVLKNNIGANNLSDKIEVRMIGLHNSPCYLEKIVEQENNSGATEFVKSAAPTDFRATSLDADLSKYKNILCIKLDVQNLEIEVLRGGQNILKTQKPIIIAEAMSDNNFIAINAFLKQFKYKISPNSGNRLHFNCSPTYIWE